MTYAHVGPARALAHVAVLVELLVLREGLLGITD